LKDSRKIIDCNLKKEQAHLLRGFFKVGLFVRDVEKAEQYFRGKGIAIRHPLFHDNETATSAFIWRIPTGICYNLSRIKIAGRNELFF
jgi:hypothetical protein